MAAVMINWWAVLGAAVASMILGMLWYGPVFGKQWMRLMRFTPQSVKRMKLKPAQAMGIGFVSTLVVSLVLAHFVDIMGATTWMHAVVTAFWIWLGFSAPLLLGSFLWEGRPLRLWVLNAAFRLVELIVMAIILTLWV